ncbi:MAG: nucleotidyltransferase [Kiritimatiellaeota bacterium]|nr:nucleotidyltransferase [Kiritimatiellota bacterium]
MGDLNSLLQRLIRHQVDFVVVGGYAAVAHGSSLVTMDVDICGDFSAGNLRRLQEALADLHPVHRMTPRRLPLRITPEFCRGLKNLYLDTDLGQLDCLNAVLGIGEFPAVRRRSVTIRLPFGRCRILALDALIEAKQAMNRPRDQETVLQLRAIQERLKRGARASDRRGTRRRGVPESPIGRDGS